MNVGLSFLPGLSADCAPLASTNPITILKVNASVSTGDAGLIGSIAKRVP